MIAWTNWLALVEGESLTRWTVRVALALYVTSLATRFRFPKASRLAWTIGCLAYLMHVACAFQFFHFWSDAEAYAFTAQQTAAVIGLDWGGGLYVNYVFTFTWIADVVWWWADVKDYRERSRWIEWAVQGFMAFIAFNATVVFASGFSRWFGIGATVLLVSFFFILRRRRQDFGHDR